MFSTILTISFRNFLRQRRRNILIGSSIAFGMMIMMIANSFSSGLSDNILNRMVFHMTGHVKVQGIENGRIISPIFRDGQAVKQTILASDPNILKVTEDIGGLVRVIGKGKGDYAWLVNAQLDDDFTSVFSIKKGSFDYFESLERPLMLSEQKAQLLNVDIGDSVNIRASNVNGQTNTGTFYVAIISKNVNMFMNYAIFSKTEALKSLLGYQAWESGAYKLLLKDPKLANQTADNVHQNFIPQRYGFEATINDKKAWIIPAESNDLFKDTPVQTIVASYEGQHPISSQQTLTYSKKSGIATYNEKKNSIVTYNAKKIRVSSFKNAIKLPTARQNKPSIYIIQKNEMFKQTLPNLPLKTLSQDDLAYAAEIASKNGLILATAWTVVERTKDPVSFEKKMKQLMRNKTHQPTIDVASMYETAKDVIGFEKIFNFIVFIVSVVLFAIIMIGVLNSLRMTIRERTKEIGTLRAIGLQRRHLLWIFLCELFMLVCVSSFVGILASFGAMKGLSLFTFAEDNALNMIMVDHRLYFLPTIAHVIKNVGLVLGFTFVTVFIPCLNAANMDPCKALRH